MCSLCLLSHLQPNKEALKDRHAPTPVLKPRLDYNIATSWPVHNTSPQNSLGSLILFYLGGLCNYTVWNFNFENLPVFFFVSERLWWGLNDRWEWEINQYTRQNIFFLSRDNAEKKKNKHVDFTRRERGTKSHFSMQNETILIRGFTYSIGIGEVSSVSQPAAEVVVRASSA